MRRIREVLETHDWSGEPEEDHDSDSGGFDLEVNELEREMMGLKFAVQNGEDDRQEDPEKLVEEMDALVERMRAIKGKPDPLPPEVQSAKLPRHECRYARVATQGVCVQGYS